MKKAEQQRYWQQMVNIPMEQRQFIYRLHRYATTLHRLEENSCNGWPMMKIEVRDGKTFCFDVEDEKWRLRDEKKEASINKKIEEIAKITGWKIETQGDPRGWPMSLKIGEVDFSFLVNV